MSDTLRKIVATNIRKLRKAKGLSQMEFARCCGLTPRYASRMENDPQNLGLDTMGKVADVLGVAITELFNFPTSTVSPQTPAEAFASIMG